MIPLLTALLAFDPLLSGVNSASASLAPHPVVIHTAPVEGPVLRGDYDSGERVALVYTDSWPELLATISSQVVASGAELLFVREEQSAAPNYEAFVAGLRSRFGPRLDALPHSVDTPWIRDWGPIQARDPASSSSVWLDSDYDDNERGRDDEAPALLAEPGARALTELPWPLDGGAIVSNGAGLCVMTLEYLEIEAYSYADDDLGGLLARLGCRATALVPTLIHDATKHADMIVQFTGPGRAMVTEIVEEPGEGVAGGEPGEDVARMQMVVLGLRHAAASLGVELEIVPVPTPGANEEGLSFSFVNGLRLRDRYLMPNYAQLDERANLLAWAAVQAAVGDAVPVIPVDASVLIDLGGAIHCMSLGLF